MLLRNTFLMKKLVFAIVAGVLFVGVSAKICRAQDEKKEPITFSQKDRDSIVKYFTETHGEFEDAISGLSEAQLNFRPNEKSWTIAQAAEHIVITDGAIFGLIKEGALKSPLNTNPDVFRVRDIAVRLAVTNRGQKFNAPEAVQPQQKLTTVEQLISGFKAARSENIDFLKNTEADLRNHFADNGLIGMLDAYQWFLFMNGHTERHLAQIEEIKADKNYPSK